MKKLVMALIISAVGATVNAQVRIPMQVYCGSTETIMKSLQEEYREHPVWTSATEDRKSVFMFLSNDKTDSWTFLKFNESIACVLAAGDDGRWLKPSR